MTTLPLPARQLLLTGAVMVLLGLLDTAAGQDNANRQILPVEELSVSSVAKKDSVDDGLFFAAEPAFMDDPRFQKLQDQIDTLSKADRDRAGTAARLPTARIVLQLQPDFLWFDQDEVNRATVGELQNGSAFRRARIGLTGTYGPTEYRIEFDWALAARPNFLDVWLAMKDILGVDTIKAGHFFEPFSLERVTPNRFMVFLERSLIDSAFTPARNLGLMAQDEMPDERGTWAVGVFRTISDDFGDDVGDSGEHSLTGRITRLLWYDDADESLSLLHLGAAYSFRDADNRQSQFRSQPEARVGSIVAGNVPYFVDTGSIPTDSFQLFGLEAAWVEGPFSAQAEYIWSPVNTIGGPTVAMQGWYAQVSWFLTGEHRPFKKATAVFDRVIPHHDLVPGSPARPADGPGAWELAARLSHLDLNDKSISGGELSNLTVGANWYLNPFLHMSVNYIHAFLTTRRPEIAALTSWGCD